MNAANKLTLSRFIITFAFVITSQYSDSEALRWVSYGISIIAALTDFLDGYIARKLNIVTDFGRLMDPLADKIFVAAAFFILVNKSIIPDWFAILILSREFAVTGLRQIAASKNIIIQADALGKIKMALQFTYLALVGAHWAKNNEEPITNTFFNYTVQGIMLATAIITVYSGYNYFAKNKSLYMDDL